MEGLLSLVRRLIPRGLYRRVQPLYHLSLAVSGNLAYRFPTRGMVVIAVTGTNGKTTTTLVINELLKAAGKRTGLASTTTLEVAGEVRPNLTNRTNLGRWQFVRLASQMRRAGVTHLVVEAASEGIAQHRLWGVPVDVAVFTNLSPDHLNTHGTMENYRRVKERIFAALGRTRRLPGVQKVSVVNADDPVASHFLAYPADRKLTYALKKDADFRAGDIEPGRAKTRFSLWAEGGAHPIELSLVGEYNVSNAAAAIAAARSLGVEWETITTRLAQPIEVPGRMEEVSVEGKYRVIVDYAHSEDALRNLYQTLRAQEPKRLIAVLGATGDRDRAKRPILGAVAGEHCDLVYVTNEEPYSEDPMTIIGAVASGLAASAKLQGSDYFIIPDRREAIRAALSAARAGDIVVVTGMGHQRYMTVGERKVPWHDPTVIREEAEKLG